MNGQKILQTYRDNQWATSGKIKKAEEGLKPGIYNLYLSKAAETDHSIYEGVILMADKEAALVFQQVGKDFVTHELALFKTPLPVGKNVAVQYDNNKIILSKIEGIKKKRSHQI